MRTLLLTAASTLVAGTGVFSLISAGAFASPCSQPITYQVGSIDPEFTIATSTVRGLLQDAEETWEAQTDTNLFTHAPESGELKIDFIFDERQRRTNLQEEFATNLSSLRDTHTNLTEVLQTRRETYEQRLAAYEQDRQAYEKRLAEYNQRVDKLNQRNRPVASSTKRELESTRKQLQETRENLQKRQDELNALRQEINELAQRSNSLAETYNQKASTFNERFGTTRKFDQAVYTGDTINVYQFKEASDLRLALVHEFGHALGINHVEDPKAVMHYLMDKQQLNPVAITEADMEALNRVCQR